MTGRLVTHGRAKRALGWAQGGQSSRFLHESVNAAGLIVTALYREGWIDVHEWQRITKVLMAASKRRVPPFVGPR